MEEQQTPAEAPRALGVELLAEDYARRAAPGIALQIQRAYLEGWLAAATMLAMPPAANDARAAPPPPTVLP